MNIVKEARCDLCEFHMSLVPSIVAAYHPVLMTDNSITRISADDVHKLEPGKTDWKRLRSLLDEEIEAAMRDDPDWADIADVDWSKAVVVVPKRKKAISIRLDEDVVEFFKEQGEGYQTRMNAVLRHYMESTKKPDAE